MKRRRGAKRARPVAGQGVDGLESKIRHLCSNVTDENPSVPSLDARTMLSNSYQKNLDDIRRIVAMVPRDTGGTPTGIGGAAARLSVVPVSREWEESFLHEPCGVERPCVSSHSQNGCWASKLCENAGSGTRGHAQRDKLVLVEFYTPDEHAAIEANGWKWPEEKRHCVLCGRVAAHTLFVQARASSLQVAKDISFSCVSNLVDVPGEYHSRDCFVSSPDRFEGVIDPVVLPRLGDYDIRLRNGVRHVHQRCGKPVALAAVCNWSCNADFRH